MSDARLDLYVLDVLQGLGTFAAIYNDAGVLVNTILLDLGTERVRKDDPFPSVTLVANLLKTMAQPTLDAVILSHSDTDHISLIAQLLSHFVPVGTPFAPVQDTLVVKQVKYGGEFANYTKGKARFNVLNELKKYFPVDSPPVQRLFSAAAQETSFPARETKTNPWRPWVKVGDASVYILIANTVPAEADLGEDASELTRKVPDDYAKNVVSIVSIVDFRSSQMVITGDATGLTLAQCNLVMEASDVGVDLLIDNFMVTAPHHGAERTTYDLLGITSSSESREQVAERNLKAFVDNMYASTLTASAGLVKKFRHPSARVLQAFWPRLGAGAWNDPVLSGERHFYTAYFTQNQYTVNDGSGSTAQWPTSENWYSVQSSKNLFSNLYFLSPNQAPVLVPPSPGQLVTPVASGPSLPPLGANWIFRVPRPLGVKRSVLRLSNRVTTLALRAQMLGLRPTAAFTPAPAAFPAAAAAQAPPLTLDTPPGLVPIGPPAFALPVLGLASAPPRHAAPAPAPAPPAGLRGLKVVP